MMETTLSNKTRILLEDLLPGDLNDLVDHVIEIDAYKPKIDDSNIVVSFRVTDESPAYDLSRFIEFSTHEVLDTEVSNAPDANGKYTVYVEFTPANIAKKVYRMLQIVSYLTDTNEWTYKAYGKKAKLSVE